VLDFIRGVTYVHFCNDKLVRYAVERRIEVIGEAARHISESFKIMHPEIPWRRIIGQRNILAHEYGEILLLPLRCTESRNLCCVKIIGGSYAGSQSPTQMADNHP